MLLQDWIGSKSSRVLVDNVLGELQEFCKLCIYFSPDGSKLDLSP